MANKKTTAPSYAAPCLNHGSDCHTEESATRLIVNILWLDSHFPSGGRILNESTVLLDEDEIDGIVFCVCGFKKVVCDLLGGLVFDTADNPKFLYDPNQ